MCNISTLTRPKTNRPFIYLLGCVLRLWQGVVVIFGYCKYLKEHINFPVSIGFVVSVSADSSVAARRGGGGVIKNQSLILSPAL